MNLPEREMPRERLQRVGAGALSLPELLAVLLGSGTRGINIQSLAENLVCRFGGLESLSQATLEELLEVKGLGKAKALQLLSALEIGKRTSALKLPDYPYIRTAEDAYNHLKPLFNWNQEQLAVLLLDVKGRAFRRQIIGKGILNAVLAHPREIFAPVIEHRASSFIVAHNHPSGDPSPSDADKKLTQRLLEGAKLLSIALDDHIILGPRSFYSFLHTR